MSRTDVQAPSEIISAVETLEQATSPVDLGPAYKAVLDWRGRGPRWTFGARLYHVAAILAFIAALFLVNSANIEISDYWRGFLFGAVLIVALGNVRDWSARRSQLTMTFVQRVDAAIDRWRHAVPAMRDFPR